jgi:hypothetical protein
MDETNPYEAPEAPLREGTAIGVKSGRIADVRRVAVAQKGILVCLLLQFLVIGASFAANFGVLPIPEVARLGLSIASLVVGVAQIVFVFMLAMRVYSTVAGIFLGLLAFIPCLGLLILLIVNGRATTILTANGYKVGLMGADLAEIPREG